MNQNNFAERLKVLMKERKISGQKIADAIGVSQKTISRYTTGENEPNEDMQKKILNAIAKISGHPEDAEYMNKKKPFNISLRKLMESKNSFLMTDEEILIDELRELERDKNFACRAFSMLQESNQKFVLEWYEVFCGLEAYEIAIVEAFAIISKEMQDFVLESLENLHMGCKEMMMYPSVCKKIGNYMTMISECKSIVQENWSEINIISKSYESTQLTKQYAECLEKSKGLAVELLGNCLQEIITFDERDWYLLMLVQFLKLKDKGANLTYNGYIIGDKVFGLLNYLERQVKTNEKEK